MARTSEHVTLQGLVSLNEDTLQALIEVYEEDWSFRVRIFYGMYSDWYRDCTGPGTGRRELELSNKKKR